MHNPLVSKFKMIGSCASCFLHERGVVRLVIHAFICPFLLLLLVLLLATQKEPSNGTTITGKTHQLKAKRVLWIPR